MEELINRAVIISMTRSATTTAVADADPQSLIRAIGAGKWRGAVRAIREKYKSAVADGEDAKKAVAELKKQLPGILWSGRFHTRAATGLVEHSGLLCLDLDHLDSDEITRLHTELHKDPHTFACFVSPTGTGLKVVLRIPADADRH